MKRLRGAVAVSGVVFFCLTGASDASPRAAMQVSATVIRPAKVEVGEMTYRMVGVRVADAGAVNISASFGAVIRRDDQFLVVVNDAVQRPPVLTVEY